PAGGAGADGSVGVPGQCTPPPTPGGSAVAMDAVRRERGQAHGNVLRALRLRRAVLDPLATARDHRLPRADVERTARVTHAQHAAQDDRVLVEVRRLSRLDPAGGAPHVRDAHRLVLRIYRADHPPTP